MVPARLEWINQNPEAIGGRDIAHYFPIDSWILVKFGGEVHTNYSSAMESGFFDLEKRLWLDEWYSIFDIDDSFFPLTVSSGEIIGNVSKSIQERLNLQPDTEIVAGLPDTQAALFAVNAVSSGSICVVLGTTTPVQAVSENLLIDPDGHTWSSGLVIKNICDNYIVEGSTGITGQPVKWAAHMFDSEQRDEYPEPTEKQYENIRKRFSKFDEKEQSESEESVAEHSVYANVGPLPLATTSTSRLAGEFYFPSPSGVEEFYIHQNQLIGAIFDNIMFAVAKNIEYTKKLIKHDQISLYVVGGISRYSLLSQRISDLVNIPLSHYLKPEATIQGLLSLCDVASGKINTPKDLEYQLSKSGDLQRMEPRESMTNKLQKKFEKWLQIVNLDI
jgi:sugar (pentulose or hexulose) kinase